MVQHALILNIATLQTNSDNCVDSIPGNIYKNN